MPPRLRRALAIAAVWAVFALLLSAQRYLRGPTVEPGMALGWWETLSASVVTAALWALLTPPAMRLARSFRPRRGALLRTLPLLVLASAAAALVHLTATNLVWEIADSGSAEGFSDRFFATLAFGGAARLMTFAGILGATWALDDYRAYRRKALRSSELERDLVQTELEALERRLHPTFLFRNLEGLLPLIRREPRTAAAMVVQLGDVLRRTLHQDEGGLVPLRAELDSIALYLDVEQTRLGSRLEVSRSVQPALLDVPVPHRILVPLVESAIANGAARSADRRRIEIRAWADGRALRLEVRERGLGALGTETLPLDASFVETARRRLELLFPSAHAITVSARADGHSIALELPLWAGGARASGVPA